MKLKFTIHYGTQWGENLVVMMTYRSQDRTEKIRKLLMTTADGWQWELETSAIESRQHPITSFSYYYQGTLVFILIYRRYNMKYINREKILFTLIFLLIVKEILLLIVFITR